MTRAWIPFILVIGVAVFAGCSFAAAGEAKVRYVPVGSAPSVPAGLKVTCMNGPNILTSSKTCPVVVYNGNTTWAYSFIDNRVSMALVTYDAKNNIISNVTKNGARYVWNIISSGRTKSIEVFGQSNQSIQAKWDELGATAH